MEPVHLRQVVLAAAELEPVAGALRAHLGLGEPFSDPAVAHFGLRNAVFALGDTFIEVVSPVRPGTAAGRRLERRGADGGYMVMFQVADLAAVRERAAAAGVREVFEVALEDMAEVHLHPADLGGAIVSASVPTPPGAWRWGGPDWQRRRGPGRVTGVQIAVRDPEAVAVRWRAVLGELPPVRFAADEAERGLAEVELEGVGAGPATIGGVRFR